MQQGKAILLSLGLPLIAAYALEFAAAPTRARWLRLALAQIAAVGVSASALWAAPAVAGLALASAQPLRAGWLRNLALGLAASAYPLLLALVLRAETSATFAAAGTVRESSVMFEEAIRVVIGRNPIGYVTLFCVLGAWALAATALARRFAVVFTLAFLLVFWSPLTVGWIAAHVTSPLTYWRVFWLLPVPALVGLALAGPLAAGGSRRSVRVGRLAIAGLAATLFLWLPARHPASSTSGVRLAPPGWKIAPAALAAARAVRDHAPEGAPVLAPASVAAWIPALHRHPQPLVVRRGYLALLRNALGQSELDRRAQLELLVSGARRPPHSDRLLREAIARDPLAAVCVAQSTNRWPDVRAALEASGFQSVMRNSEYEVFAPER
jgi:hypothetical protein